ncbi:acyl-homoserine-lactone synthase [Jiella flava]|uniref:Acyl-homoserine-lactone synthase n=1 Tax=Jiella flava TaxID=2816857 RepID=A0A939FZD7_9HYPH|nr:acyl-homoserine-lactone synthase [Jiella flava]MBO0662803.1 autoinducer synthase [Jiella flava]
MEQVWKFRHRHFVDRFQWHALRKPDAREIDQFDGDNAVHLPLVLDGIVRGYTRLLRTDQPHLLSDVYPELMDGAIWPRADDIFEWTRCVGEPEIADNNGVSANNLVFVGVAEAVIALGLRGLIVQTHPKLVTRLLETGWQVHPLNVPRIYDGKPLAVIFAVATEETIRISRSLFQIDRPILSVEANLPHPSKPSSEFAFPPVAGVTHSRIHEETQSTEVNGNPANSEGE